MTTSPGVRTRTGRAGRVCSVLAYTGLAVGCAADAPSTAAEQFPFGLDDVSVLLPLPAGFDDPRAVALSSAASGGVVLDEARFSLMPAGQDAQLPYASWRIVSARIDPCFPDLGLLASNPAACRRQIRLIAQPLVTIAAGEGAPAHVGFADSAMHLMYDLSAAQFDDMSQRWLALATPRTSAPERPLDIHFEITQEGRSGQVATGLRAVILAYAGPPTLSQVTSIHGSGPGFARDERWDFSGFRVIAGANQVIAIPGLGGATTQTTTSSSSSVFAIAPASTIASGLAPLAGVVAGDGAVSLTGAPAEITAALQLSLDVDNPATPFNADTVDCASCHAAGRARTRAAALGFASDGLDAYASTFNLKTDVLAPVGVSLQQQRAFGFNGTQAVWNQRVVNESAAIAAYFNAKLRPTATRPPQ